MGTGYDGSDVGNAHFTVGILALEDDSLFLPFDDRLDHVLIGSAFLVRDSDSRQFLIVGVCLRHLFNHEFGDGLGDFGGDSLAICLFTNVRDGELYASDDPFGLHF